MLLEDNSMEGSSGLNTNAPYASQDTMGYRRYRYIATFLRFKVS